MQARLNAADAAGSDNLGYSVAIDGNTAIVGSYLDDHAGGNNAGSAYIFVRSGPNWTQQFKLIASDAAANDSFGYAVSISGETAVVSTPFDNNTNGAVAGGAYVFVRSGMTWTQQAKLIASDGQPGDTFGASVAIDGNTIVVGAQGDQSAYVFVRSGSVWTQQAKLTARNPDDDSFGVSVSVDGDTAIVGAHTNDHLGGINAGAAYVFVRSGTSWSQQAKLTASDAAAEDQFGVSVSIDNNTALIGAYTDDHAGGVDAGSAYVFVRSGTSWSQQAKLIGSGIIAGNNFGWSVSIDGNTALVGANLHDPLPGPAAGAAYVFVRPGGGPTWFQQSKIAAYDGTGGDQFGIAVAVTRDVAIIGSFSDDTVAIDTGSAYVVALGDNSCRVDVTGDGLINLDDLLGVINGWGACP